MNRNDVVLGGGNPIGSEMELIQVGRVGDEHQLVDPAAGLDAGDRERTVVPVGDLDPIPVLAVRLDRGVISSLLCPWNVKRESDPIPTRAHSFRRGRKTSTTAAR